MRPFSTRLACVLCAMLAVASLSFTTGQETSSPKSAAKLAPAPAVAAPEHDERPAPQARAAAPQVGRGFISSIRERREKRKERGLELPKLFAIGEELKAEGEIYKGMPDEEIVAAIAARLEADNPNAFAEANAVDWQAIFDLIERLLPILLKLLGL